jgi:hypothetical protein
MEQNIKRLLISVKKKGLGKFAPYPHQHPMLRNVMIAEATLASNELQI